MGGASGLTREGNMDEERAERIKRQVAEAIDKHLYLPLKAEIDRTPYTSRLGFLKEQLKQKIESIVDEQLKVGLCEHVTCPYCHRVQTFNDRGRVICEFCDKEFIVEIMNEYQMTMIPSEIEAGTGK